MARIVIISLSDRFFLARTCIAELAQSHKPERPMAKHDPVFEKHQLLTDTKQESQ